MSDTAAICPHCARPLAPSAPQGLCPACLAASLSDLFGEAARGEAEPLSALAAPHERVGDYELLDELGRGGMGVVFRARDRRLHRVVALKLILTGQLASEAEVKRFRNEAEAAAQLEHPHIVPIYEVGESGGRHFFAMKLVEGGTLSDRISNLNFQISNSDAATLLATVARAVHHAHQRGILHRDLKPGNILLAAAGEPLVADFGLARRVGGSTGITMSGAVLGSPNYMAPEQAAGDSRAVTTAADIYSLGAVLYELLAGRPPFVGATALEVLRKVVEEEVPVEPLKRSRVKAGAGSTPQRCNAPTPADLITICLKCLQKNPRQRYATAEALAEDLERWQRNEPIRARPTPFWERSAKWARRKPAWALVALLLLLAPAVSTIVLLVMSTKVKNERNIALIQKNFAIVSERRATNARLVAEAERNRTRTNLYAADITSAHAALALNHFGAAGQALAAHRPAPGQSDLRDWEWHWLWRQAQGDAALVCRGGHSNGVLDVSFSPDGRALASSGNDNSVRLWDAVSGEPRAVLTMPEPPPPLASLYRGHVVPSPVRPVTFSPDGQRVAAFSTRGLRIWNSSSGQLLAETNLRVWWGAFLPGLSQELAVAYVSEPRTNEVLPADRIAFFDAALRPTRPALPTTNKTFCVSADGQWLAESDYRTVRLWNLHDGTQHAEFISTNRIVRLDLSPDGARLVAAYQMENFFDVWDPQRGERLARVEGATGHTVAAAFSPDGRLLASAGRDEAVRLWDAATGQELRTFLGHSLSTECVAFSPDGQMLASGGKDGSVRLWSLAPAVPSVPLTNVSSPLAFSTDGRWVAARQNSGGLAVWELASRRRRQAWDDARPVELFFPQGENSLVAASLPANGLPPEIWNYDPISSASARRFRLPELPSPATCLTFTSDGQLCVTGHGDGSLRWWHGRDGRLLETVQPYDRPVKGVRFSPEGRYLISWPDRPLRRLVTWSTATRQPLTTNQFGGSIFSLAFAPDGAICATAGDGNDIRLWHTATLDLAGILPEQRSTVDALAWSPRGRTLASVGYDGKLQLWHLPTGRLLFTLLDAPPPGEKWAGVAFSPDGQWLGAADSSGQLHLWHGGELATPAIFGPP